MNKAKLTVGIVSCNRKYYLKSLIESLKQTVDQDIELIVIDNASTEIGLRDYLIKEKFISRLIMNKVRKPKTEHMTALNQIVKEAKTEYLLILSDDIQFIRKNWITDSLFILEKYDEINSVSLSALRKSTLQKIFGFNKSHILNILRDIFFRKKIRFQKKYKSINENFISFGYMREPIDGVGMLTICKTSLWKNLYPWHANDGIETEFKDSSGGGEYYMIKKARKNKIRGHMITSNLPVIATIVTDKKGFNAKIRENFRFGKYFPPTEKYYYKISENKKNENFIPFSFEEYVIPEGIILPLDKNGNLIKGSINLDIKEKI